MREILDLLARPVLETILMVISSTAIAAVLGGAGRGSASTTCPTTRLSERARQLSIVKKVADRAINVLRSFPFIILMVLVLPLSRLIVGTSLGTVAAIVPLSIAASPFIARIVEASLSEVDAGIMDAAIASGASKRRILFAILVPEALPSLVSGLTLTMISLVGYSAMRGRHRRRRTGRPGDQVRLPALPDGRDDRLGARHHCLRRGHTDVGQRDRARHQKEALSDINRHSDKIA